MRTADRMGPLSAECINRPDDRKHRRLAQFDLCEWPRGTSHMPSMACCLGAQSSSKELESEILMRYSMHYPPVWFFPCDFKSGCLWMLSLELTAVQRAQVLKTASDLCVMARRDRDSVLFSDSSLRLSSNLPAGRRMMDRRTRPSIFVTLLW